MLHLLMSALSMADALFSQTRQRVLGLLFGQPDRDFGTVELIELAGVGRGSVQRELKRLELSGLVSATSGGRHKRYHANPDSPIFHELRGLVDKTSGVAHALRSALEQLEDRITLAILFGSIAKGTDRAGSDIDVLLVSDTLTLEEVFKTLATAEERLGRRVSPTVYTVDEFKKRRGSKHFFIDKILAGPHQILLGELDDLAAG